MATTTTNFGWDIPQSTDLVKDGATAIAALGQDIDTSMVDLKGGTTGQILSKTSNTDMDFTWINNDQGDITGVTAGTGLTGGGTSGSVTLDFDIANYGGGQGAAGKNAILNGAFDIWQRGTSGTNNGTSGNNYNADRWNNYLGSGAITISRQATGDTTNLPNIQYCARVQRNSGNTAAGSFYMMQPLETVNSIPFAGKAVTVSFYARKGANYSGGNLAVLLQSGTGTDQNPYSGLTGGTDVVNSSATLTTTWQRFTYTGTVATTATQLAFYVYYTTSGTAGAADYYEITGVQLELGSTATPFKRNSGSYGAELAACQRYYWRCSPNGSGRGVATAQSVTSTSAELFLPFPVEMRTNPTALEQTGTAGDYTVKPAGSAVACSAVPAFSNATTFMGQVTLTVASGLTAGQIAYLRQSGATNSYLGWSAEL